MLRRVKDFVIRAIEWKARNGILLLRMSLGGVFLWFGFIKYFPELSRAEAIASETISAISFGLVGPGFSMPFLATWECIIGIGLLSGKKMPFVLLLLYLQMIGTIIPLIIFMDETWTATPFVPTLLGQYIIKNSVLISAAIVIGATSNGGALVSDPSVALKALDLQDAYRRYRRRFGAQPPSNKKF